MRNFLVSLLIVGITTANAEPIPGEDLFAYFSANCRGQGEWSRQAINDSLALIKTLDSMVQDPDCKNLAASSSQLSILQTQLERVNALSTTQSQMAEYNYKEQTLLIQLSQTTDSDALALINAQLRDIQMLRSGLLGRESTKNDLLTQDKTQLMAGVIQTADSAFRQLAGNKKCLAKNQSILNSATSIMASIGATAAIVNPALGIGLSAGAAVLGTTIQGVRDAKIAKKIRKVSDQTIYYQGYKCALETMSENWCQMKDAESFLTFRDNQNKTYLENDLGRALSLNDKEIPELIRWLETIRSGVEPSTIADANGQNAVTDREALVLSTSGRGIGFINTQMKIVAPGSDWNTFRSIVKTLIPYDNMGSSTINPMNEVLNLAFAPYYLIGYDTETHPDIYNETNREIIGINNYIVTPNAHLDLEYIKKRYELWVKKAKNKISLERSQVLQPDALAIITMARDITNAKFKISALDSMKSLIDFLDRNPPRDSDAAFRKIHKNTLQKLKTIYGSVIDALLLDTAEGNAEDLVLKKVVQDIFDQAQLQYGTIVFKSRLDLMVRVAVLELMETSPPQDQTVVAQILAAERFTDALTKSTGKSTTEIRREINDTKPMTVANLESFVSIFSSNINDLLESLFVMEKNATTPTVAATKRYQRAQLCHYLLAAPDVRRLDLKYCLGLKMEAIIQGGPETAVLTQASFDQDFGARVCTVREYFRQSSIYNIWNIRK